MTIINVIIIILMVSGCGKVVKNDLLLRVNEWLLLNGCEEEMLINKISW